MHDLTDHLGAMDREVRATERRGEPAWILRAERVYATDVDDLWSALTDAERIPRWFLPVTGDLRVGGRYQLEGNAGGEITACDPPTHLAVTWEYGSDTSWVDVRLASEPSGGTRLVLEHTAHVPDERWDEFGPGAAGIGWDMAMLGLGLHLEGGGDAPAPEEAAARMSSPEGRAFLIGASDGWRDASIAAGTDRAAAEASAARAAAFYTGEPVDEA